MSRLVRVGTAQPLRRKKSGGCMTIKENLQNAVEIINAAPNDCDIMCFPETFSVASIENEKSRPFQENCTDSLQFLEVLGKAASKKDMCLALGLPFENKNSILFLNRKGHVIGRHDKVHLTGNESLKIERGNELDVIEMDFGKVGGMICYELYFPEHARILALKGAEIIFHPTRINNLPTEKAFESLCTARAVENICWVVSSSFCSSPPFDYSGFMARSFIVDPYGMILAEVGREPGFTTALIDLDLRKRFEESDQGFSWADFMKGRQPKKYNRIII